MQINGRIVNSRKISNEREIDLRKEMKNTAGCLKTWLMKQDLLMVVEMAVNACFVSSISSSIASDSSFASLWSDTFTQPIVYEARLLYAKKERKTVNHECQVFPLVPPSHSIAQCWGLHASSILSGSAESNWWLGTRGRLWHSSITGGVPYLKDQD